MKIRLQATAPLLVSATVFLLPLTAPAPVETRTTGADTNSTFGTTSVKSNLAPRRKTVTITLTALTPPRPWKNAESKVITAALIAHDRPETEKDEPPVIVKGGMIRLLVDKKIFDIRLDSLSREDQNYVEELVFAIEEAEERKATPKENPKEKKDD